jgi:uncharacterized membrane protein
MAGRMARCRAHLTSDSRTVRRVFDDALLARIEASITRSEQAHAAELRVAIEASLPLREAWRGRAPRDRALEVFGMLGVWDSAGNNGVLLYVLWADHAVEIVADRAAAEAIPQQQWREICDALSAAYRAGDFAEGTLAAIDRIDRLLIGAFPAAGGEVNEQPDRPVIL